MLCYKEEIMNNAPHTWVWSDTARYVEMGECEYVSLCISTAKMKECAEGGFIPSDENEEDAALTRYANELTNGNAETLQEATENLIKIVKEDK